MLKLNLQQDEIMGKISLIKFEVSFFEVKLLFSKLVMFSSLPFSPFFLFLFLSLFLHEGKGVCVDTIAGGGSASSPEAARFSALSAVATAFPFTCVAAKPNTSDIYVAGRGSIYLRLGFSGDVIQVVGTATSTLDAVMSTDKGESGLTGTKTSLCGSENCIYGLSFSPLDGTLYFVSSKYIRSLSSDGIVRIVAGTGQSSWPYGDGGPATSATFKDIGATAVHATELGYGKTVVGKEPNRLAVSAG